LEKGVSSDLSAAITNWNQPIECNDFIESYNGNMNLVPGRHVIISRGAYFHHAIIADDQKNVIHFSGVNVRKLKKEASIRQDSWEHFVHGETDMPIYWMEYGIQLKTLSKIAEKSKSTASKQNQSGQYDLFFNNCEHFATLASCGIKSSSQVNRMNKTGKIV